MYPGLYGGVIHIETAYQVGAVMYKESQVTTTPKHKKGYRNRQSRNSVAFCYSLATIVAFPYFLEYITSFTRLTVRPTVGKASSTRFGA